MAAVELRKAGHSYGYITSKVGVSKGTLAVWLADVPYTPNIETVERIGRARAASGEAKSRIKRESIKQASEEARRDIGTLSRRDLFMLGIGLYIGEGAKSGTTPRFANSDPATVIFMIKWFIRALGLSKRNLALRIHLYPDCDERKSLQYWSETTNISLDQFYKTSIDRRTNKKSMKAGKLPHGTAHLIVKSCGEKRFGAFLFRKITAWSERILNV